MATLGLLVNLAATVVREGARMVLASTWLDFGLEPLLALQLVAVAAVYLAGIRRAQASGAPRAGPPRAPRASSAGC